MKLYFFRHAHADWPDWSGADDERPLTKKGRKQARRMAKFLGKICACPAVILSSPLPRAFQTAQIAADCLGLGLKEEPTLAKGFDLAGLRTILKRSKAEELMLVGHEPDFTRVIEKLTGGRVKLAKSGVARIDLESRAGPGTLAWLVSPKCLRH